MKISNRITLLFFFFFLLLATNAYSLNRLPMQYQEKSKTLNSGEEVQIKGKFHPTTEKPVRVQGGLTEYLYSTDESDFCRFINENFELFNISSENILVDNCRTIRDKTYFNASQKIDNRQVMNTRIMLRCGQNGKIFEWGSDIVDDKGYIWNNIITSNQAKDILINHTGIYSNNLNNIKEIWYRSDDVIVPVYLITVGNNIQRFTGIINALTGDIISVKDGVFHTTISGAVQGNIYPVNSYDELVQVPIGNQYVRLDTANYCMTDINGEYLIEGLTELAYNVQFRLENQYYNINNRQLEMNVSLLEQYDPFMTVLSAEPPAMLDLTWESTDSMELPDCAVNIFYHLENMRSYLLQLDPDLGYFDSPLMVFPEQTDDFMASNAGFMPAIPGMGMPSLIMFGVGNDTLGNFGEFTEIIIHEFTHAITYLLIPADIIDFQFEAMHEGLSDYFPASRLNRPRMGIGFFLDDTSRYIRNVDNDLVFPDDFWEDPHHDGQILSGTFWDIREVLGAEYTDELVHFARYGQPLSFEDYYHEILIVDDDNDNLEDGTPNYDLITQIFSDRGIIENSSSVRESGKDLLPDNCVLNNAYPNPFNSVTRLSFDLKVSENVKLRILNILGQEVASIANGRFTAGSHKFSYNAEDLATGIYFLRLETNTSVSTQKIVLLK